ncbi:MAG: radical SAM family heme chaperone HemW [Bacteroidales bacterium]|nr:radical SAM family heme chaperone HemW [Bacteroidales bacterium]
MKRIYIHVPFCIAKCAYCDFYSIEGNSMQKEYISALLKELEDRKSEILWPLKSLYFGGGTPSFLDFENLGLIFNYINDNFGFEDLAEITLEANPENIDAEKCSRWKELGINRLSIGIQSFNDEDLEYLQRIHSSEKAIAALKIAKNHFSNLSADLIHGISGANDERFIKNVEILTTLGIPHISMYSLSIEDRSKLRKLIINNERSNIDEETQARQFILAAETAAKNGYFQYEISNFSKPGIESQHNTAYWKGEPYAGFGPSAHSFNGTERRWNIADLKEYISAVESGAKYFETETIGQQEKYNEFILTRLRLVEGFTKQEFEQEFGEENFRKILLKTQNSPYFSVSENRIAFTREGLLISDALMSDLMEV